WSPTFLVARGSFLGMLIFGAFLAFLLVNNFSSKLLDSAFYTETLQQQDAYNRIYTQVLLDREFQEPTRDLLGNIEAVSYADALELLRQILPPDYLQRQVEGNIERSLDYFGGDAENLQVYLELEQPLASIEPTLLAYLDQQIDRIGLQDPDASKPILDQVADVQTLLQLGLQDLAQGKIPQRVPSISNIPALLRGDLFDTFLSLALSDRALDPRVRQGLRDGAPSMRQEFLAGDTRQFLKQAARAAGTPLVSDAVDRIRAELDGQERLDIIVLLAKEDPNTTEAELRRDLAEGRAGLQRSRFWGRTMSLAVVVIAAVLLGLIYVPNWTDALRWPGVALLSIGVVYLGLGEILEETLPSWIDRLVDRQLAQSSELPLSLENLIRDLATSFSQRLVAGIADPAWITIIIGVGLLAGSFLASWGWPDRLRLRRSQHEAPETALL
ncbi:MAG: hypothetical protein ACE5Q6_21060, partial [Dehalococcoidia bacterium]